MLIVRIIITFFLISIAFADFGEYKQKWLEFKETYGKNYENLAEEQLRFDIFVYNQKKIFQHNQLHSLGYVTFTLKSNEFADMTHAEFLLRYVPGAISHSKKNVAFNKIAKQMGSLSLPPHVDWRQNGSVAEVQSQGACDSSYAFATTGVLEGQFTSQTGHFIKFSEQNLLDCSGAAYNNSGCDGGSVIASLQFVSDFAGIFTEQSYPYEGSDGQCQLDGIREPMAIKSINRIKPGYEWHLQTAIATVGPIAVSFDASRESFQFYSSGIYYDFECKKNDGNHFGLAVGYGTENRLGYYIVRNTFGKSWGEDGYVRMSRFRNNNCGIANNAVFPTLK